MTSVPGVTHDLIKKLDLIKTFLSRIVDYDDWRVKRDYFLLAEKKWGPHSVDRFANHENTQLSRFNSRFWCPGTEAVDAFSFSWAGENS